MFDLLYLDGYDLRNVPLIERRKILPRLIKPFPLLRVSDHFENAGEELLEAARKTGLEGLIAKCTTSIYESRRSRDWLKLKLTSEQEFVIGGYSPGERDTSDRWRSAFRMKANSSTPATWAPASTRRRCRISGRGCSR